jgi:hypothetical protein
MNDLNSFEQKIRQSYQLPDIRPAFVNRLEGQLVARPTVQRSFIASQRRWAFALTAVLAAGVMLFSVGPSKVLAQLQSLFGFVPGAGLVDTGSPLRQLAEPVTQTRDGITLTVQSAYLSADRTVISFSVSDLPAAFKPVHPWDQVCAELPYLVLPDTSKISPSESSGEAGPDGSFTHTLRFNAHIPETTEWSELVIPCLHGAASGKGPQNWQIGLAFESIPADVPIYPATVLPTPSATTQPTLFKTAVSTQIPAKIITGDREDDLTLLSIVEQPGETWLTFGYPNLFDDEVQLNGQRYLAPFNPTLYDANGLELPAADLPTQQEFLAYEDSLINHLSDSDAFRYDGTLHSFVVPTTGVDFPVYIRQDVFQRSFPEKVAFTEVEFDGDLVQNSASSVQINREIEVGSVKMTLTSIGKDPQGGYVFTFDGTAGRVVQCKVELVDYPTDMSGNTNFNPNSPYTFDQSLQFRQVPGGMLTVRISLPAVLGDRISFIGSWSPENR